jgi:hypothetical protein
LKEYSVGTSLNKYLYAPKLEGEDVGRKRFIEGVTPEIMEVFEEIEKSPQLQRLLMEKFQQEEYPMDLALITKTIQQRSLPSRPFTPRFGRDSPDSQNLNSRPYPPRFGKRNNNNLPPYLPRWVIQEFNPFKTIILNYNNFPHYRLGRSAE